MLQIAVLIFAVAALGGLILANTVLRSKLAPWSISILHAALGATGLILTALALLQSPEEAGQYGVIALFILIIAALGGFFLASFHLRSKIAPSRIVFIHAGVAVTGFLLLAGTAFQLI